MVVQNGSVSATGGGGGGEGGDGGEGNGGSGDAICGGAIGGAPVAQETGQWSL